MSAHTWFSHSLFRTISYVFAKTDRIIVGYYNTSRRVSLGLAAYTKAGTVQKMFFYVLPTCTHTDTCLRPGRACWSRAVKTCCCREQVGGGERNVRDGGRKGRERDCVWLSHIERERERLRGAQSQTDPNKKVSGLWIMNKLEAQRLWVGCHENWNGLRESVSCCTQFSSQLIVLY